MSAADQMRAMLDQLMGSARDNETGRSNVRFDESRVCKTFLMGCCPNELLANTRMDLGECPKLHDLALKADFEIGSKTKDYFFDLEALDHLEVFLADVDAKMEISKRRLKETQEELTDEATNKLNLINSVAEQIGIRLARAEELGAEGNVEESLKLMEEVEDLKRKKLTAELEYRNTTPASSYQQQKLRVCEVCGAYLGIHDNDRRLADHFGGRLHVGFIILRKKLEELNANAVERRALREKEREERRNRASPIRSSRERRSKNEDISNRRSHGMSRDRSHDRSRDRSRDRSFDRNDSQGRKSKERKHHRSSHSKHKRSGSRERKHKSKDTDRHRKSNRNEKSPDEYADY